MTTSAQPASPVMIAATNNSFKNNSPYFRAEDESNGYVGELTTPVGWGKNADSAGGITPKLQVSPPQSIRSTYDVLLLNQPYSYILCRWLKISP